jgi:electron transfer flavoprotein beta subunit
MKILVPVKRVLDHNVKVRIKSDFSDIDFANAKMAMNPFCEVAVEEALRLKETGVASEVVVVSIGPEGVQEQIRTGLAMGADRGIHIKTEQMPDSFWVAQLLARLMEEEKPDLVILGKQAIDSDNNQTGQMLAALTGRAQGTFVSSLQVAGHEIRVDREVDGGQQTVAIRLPAIVTADLALNTPRYASLPNIMKARKKPLSTTTPVDLGVELVPHVQLLRVELPVERTRGITVSSVEDLIHKLKVEAKVI